MSGRGVLGTFPELHRKMQGKSVLHSTSLLLNAAGKETHTMSVPPGRWLHAPGCAQAKQEEG